MFESTLEQKLKTIFEVKKVTYAEPSPMGEQECIFVEVTDSLNSIKDGRAKAKVTGTITMIGQGEKLPFGFFSKQIAKAKRELTADLFFYDFEQNTKRFQNIVQRTCGFVYFFDAAYDPDQGTITDVELTVDFNEE